MPIHPVTIVIGTTLAVISSGYAFKKFVYDPHLAHYVEALWEYTPVQTEAAAPVPQRHRVPVPISARSSAVRGPPMTLRRRSTSRTQDYEVREALLPKQAGWEKTFELSSRGEIRSPPRILEELPRIERHADENTFRRNRSRQSSSNNLIDLDDAPALIFNYTPMRPESETRANPFTEAEAQSSETAMSQIPLSQSSGVSSMASSIAGSWGVPMRMSQAPLSPARSTQSPALHDSTLAHTRAEDDILSIPDTNTMSEYEDAETYSPIASRVLSPARSESGANVPLDSIDTPGYGLSWSASRYEPGLRRGPMSVVSLSESEGWRSDDWEVTSES